MIFRQLFEPASSTYTYLLADETTRRAVLVDPVVEEVETYAKLLADLGLTLVYTLETHVHADHVTAGSALRERFGSRTVVHRDGGAACADVLVKHGDHVTVDGIDIEVRETPGHTNGCVTYVSGDRAFTGDALLIGGCGRTDFQQGDAAKLHESVHGQIFSLPPDTLVYPGHDYEGRTVSTVKEELATNARLGGGRTKAEFVEIMANLKLAYPKQLHRAVPANQQWGREWPTPGESTPRGKPISFPPNTLLPWATLAFLTAGAGGAACADAAPPSTAAVPAAPEVPVSTIREIDVATLKADLDRGAVPLLVDVRTPEEYASGHVPGAKNIPLDQIEARVAELGPTDREVYLVCQSGRRSMRASEQLVAKGLRPVNVAGGTSAWLAAGYPKE
ncbi:MAG: rhodanese-like domain-containing protein [Myxococcota bacterium]